MEDNKILSVTQLNVYIKLLMQNDPVLSHVFVRGEISNFKAHTSGHLYFTLKDEESSLKCVCFKGSASKLKFTLQNGMKIIGGGRISVFERDGQYQLYVDEMQPDGIGALHIAFEQLKEKLEGEGLFSREHKKPIPKIPQRIGIATARTGAAVQDMLNILGRRFPMSEVFLYPTLVQGDGAAEEVSAAINYFNSKKLVDVIIIGRGGGSIEDLWAFNNEGLARTIFASNIPIISAVGHEIDFTISDFVADLRAPTPSAAAELCVPNRNDIFNYLSSAMSRMNLSCKAKIKNERLHLNQLVETRSFKYPLEFLEEKHLSLDHLTQSLYIFGGRELERKKQVFRTNIEKLDALSPSKVFLRGYSMATDEDGKIISTVKRLKKEKVINVRFVDGHASLKVLNLHKNKEEAGK